MFEEDVTSIYIVTPWVEWLISYTQRHVCAHVYYITLMSWTWCSNEMKSIDTITWCEVFTVLFVGVKASLTLYDPWLQLA